MQSQIVAGDVCVDHAAHILPDYGIVREHGAFRQRFRATRVDDLRQIVARKLDLRGFSRIGQEFVESNHTGHRRRLLFRRQPNKLAHLGIERASGTCDLGKAGVDSQHLGAGVPEYEGGLFGLKHEIDWDQDGAEPR